MFKIVLRLFIFKLMKFKVKKLKDGCQQYSRLHVGHCLMDDI